MENIGEISLFSDLMNCNFSAYYVLLYNFNQNNERDFQIYGENRGISMQAVDNFTRMVLRIIKVNLPWGIQVFFYPPTQ